MKKSGFHVNLMYFQIKNDKNEVKKTIFDVEKSGFDVNILKNDEKEEENGFEGKGFEEGVFGREKEWRSLH